MNLGNLIEKAVKQIELDKLKEIEEGAEAADDDDLMENSLFSDNAEAILEDGDFSQLRDLEEEWADEDEEYINSVLGGNR